MRGDNAANRFGSSRFALEHELEAAGLFIQHPQSIFMGFFNGRAVYFHGPAGATITAGARSGKLRDFLAYNLLPGTCQHSLMVLDPKAEGAYIAQDQTPDGKFWACWNPTGFHGLPQESINFLGHLTLDSPTLISDLKVFWENMLAKGKSADGDYFVPRGRQYGEAICLAIIELTGGLTFPDLYEAIMLIPGGGDDWLDFAFQMSRSRFPNVRSIEAEIASARSDSGNGFRGIIGELMKAVACLSDPILMASVAPPYTMNLEDVVAGDQAWQVYLCPPADFIGPWGPVIKSAFTALMLLKSRAPSAPRITFFIDECGQLAGGENGGFELVPRLYSYGAGIGVQPVAILQSSAQMNGLAPGAKDIMMSSSGATMMFSMRGDFESCQDCHRRMGMQTLSYDDGLAQQRAAHGRNQALQSLIGGGDPLQAGIALSQHSFEEVHQSKQQRALRTIDEIMNMPSDRAYLFHEDVEYPIELERRPYFKQRGLIYHPNPYHPPIDHVQVQTFWGSRTRRVIREPVPAQYAHYPQYRDGFWSRVER